MAALTPNFKWAQRKDRLLICIDLRDIKNEKVDLQPTCLNISFESDKKAYVGQLNFFEEIDKEASKWDIVGFQMRFVLFKKDKTKSYWKRLIKEDKKVQNIQVDWQKYIDSDEEEESGNKGIGQDWDPEMMQKFGGAGGPGGPEGPAGGDDSDDEEEDSGKLNDLEANQQPPNVQEPEKKIVDEEVKKEEVPADQPKTN